MIKSKRTSRNLSPTERDIGSQCIVPGFVEPHLHLLPTSLVSGLTNMWYEKVKNVSQARCVIQCAVQKANPGDWVVAFGYDPSLTDEHSALTRDITDAAAPNNPFLCGNPSGHVAYVNKAAFTAAGIAVRPNDADHRLTYPADDPYFVKATDGDGEYLNGFVLETAANKLTNALPSEYLGAQRLVRLGRETLGSWAQAGCTTVFDAGIGVLTGGAADVKLIIKMLESQKPLPRFGGAIAIQALNNIVNPIPFLPTALQEPPYAVGPLSLYTVKYWLDGSTQGFTAALNEPYADTTPFPFKLGLLDYRLDPDDPGSCPDDLGLLSQLEPVVRAGWQVMLHVNGSRAIDQALRVLPWALRQEPRPARHMHRLEHFTADVTADQIAAAARLGLGVSHLIAHVGTWGDAFRDYVFKNEHRSSPHRPRRRRSQSGPDRLASQRLVHLTRGAAAVRPHGRFPPDAERPSAGQGPSRLARASLCRRHLQSGQAAGPSGPGRVAGTEQEGRFYPSLVGPEDVEAGEPS